MPKRGAGLLCNFLVQHLDAQTFGDRLSWVDKEKGVFQILWEHGNSCTLDPDKDHAVFIAWDKLKCRRPTGGVQKGSKQRFRVAINKMKIKKLPTWKGQPPPRQHQFRRIPREDMELLKTPKRFEVPASPETSSTLSEEYNLYLNDAVDSSTYDCDTCVADVDSPQPAEASTDIAELLASHNGTDTRHDCDIENNTGYQPVPSSGAIQQSVAISDILADCSSEVMSLSPLATTTGALEPVRALWDNGFPLVGYSQNWAEAAEVDTFRLPLVPDVSQALDEPSVFRQEESEEYCHGPSAIFVRYLQEPGFGEKALADLFDTMRNSGLQWPE